MSHAAHWVADWSLFGKPIFVSVRFNPVKWPGGFVGGGGGYTDYEPNPQLAEYFRQQAAAALRTKP